MTRKKNIGFVVDRSDSMARIARQTISGFNEQLDLAQSDVKQGHDTRVWFTLFNHDVVSLATAAHPGAIARLNNESYVPKGTTALQDAIGFTVDQMRKDTVEETDSLYLLIILTDGEENASQNFKGEVGFTRIRALLQECEASQRWTVVFIGTPGLEAFATNMGVRKSNQIIYSPTPEGVGAMANFTRSSTAQYMSLANAGVDGAIISSNYASPTEQPVDLTGVVLPVPELTQFRVLTKTTTAGEAKDGDSEGKAP